MSSQRSFPVRGDEIPPLLREALRQLGKAPATAYSHETLVDEDACVFLYDCSGFVDYALERVAPEARDALPHTPGNRPLAKDFFEFLQELASGGKKSRAWVAVLRTADLLPGDVVAWLEPKGAQSTNTGHVAVVAERPRRRREENGDEEFLLRVIDSTEGPHALDTRVEGANGLGSERSASWTTWTANLLRFSGGAASPAADMSRRPSLSAALPHFPMAERGWGSRRLPRNGRPRSSRACAYAQTSGPPLSCAAAR
jgi:hypothetical protein